MRGLRFAVEMKGCEDTSERVRVFVFCVEVRRACARVVIWVRDGSGSINDAPTEIWILLIFNDYFLHFY